MVNDNFSDILGLWAIWQPPGSTALETLMQKGFANGTGFGKSVLARISTLDDEDEPEMPYEVSGGTAILQLVGPLMKYGAAWMGGTSTASIRDQIAQAVGDPNITSIVLLIDSPGGTVSGTKDLADAVGAASQEKPCYAYFQDCACSAAYWIGSQATKCFANPTAIVGSIGTYSMVYDYSEYYEKLGVKAMLVKAGEFKGAGLPGTKITDEQLAEWQTLIDGLNEQFVKGAAQGRKMALRTMKGLADGRAHIASKAEELGLIDGVQSFSETLKMMDKARAPRRSAKAIWNSESGQYDNDFTVEQENILQEATLLETQNPSSDAAIDVTEEPAASADNQQEIVNMSDSLETAKPAAASLAQLKEACPGASADFLLSQLDAAATVDQAGKAWTAKLTEAIAAKDAEIVALKDKASKAEAKVVGVETLGDASTGATGSSTAADPVTAFNTLLKEYVAKYNDKAVAMKRLVAEHSAEHAAYVAAFNAANPYKRRA